MTRQPNETDLEWNTLRAIRAFAAGDNTAQAVAFNTCCEAIKRQLGEQRFFEAFDEGLKDAPT